MLEKLKKQGTLHGERVREEEVDKALRLSISIVIWILSSDTDNCQLNQFNTNSEAAMLSNIRIQYMMEV